MRRLKVYDGLNWRETIDSGSGVKVYSGFFWRTVAQAWAYDGSTWNLIYTTASAVPVKHPPVSDISSSTQWIASTGGTLYTTMDEEPPSDTDYSYIQEPNGGTLIVGISSSIDPITGSEHSVMYRYRYEYTGISAAGNPAMTIRLKEGATNIKTISLILAGSPGDYGVWHSGSASLSTAEADSITDYTNLSMSFEVSDNTTIAWDASSGGADQWRVSYVTFQYPGYL